MDKELSAMRQAIVTVATCAYNKKLFSGTSGNLSTRFKDFMLITPTGIRYEMLSQEDIVVMNLNGTIISGLHQPSSEWRMHAEVYSRCPNVFAQIHTHSPYATAFAACHRSIPACLIEMHYFLGGEVPCASYATPGTVDVGSRCVEVLENHGGCLLANHGVLAVGESLEQALLRAEYIEDAAHITLLSQQLGGPVPLLEL